MSAEAHLRGGWLYVPSFSYEEARYLAKHLGKGPEHVVRPSSWGFGNPVALAFAQDWCKGKTKGQIKKLKAAFAEHCGVFEAFAEHAGVAVAPAPKAREKSPKPKRKAFDIGELPVADAVVAVLADNGLLTAKDILSEGVDGLVALPKIGVHTAKKILDALEG